MVSIVFISDCIYRPWSYDLYCFYLGMYLHTLELLFLLFLSGIVSTEPGVMVSIVFTWDCIYTPGVIVSIVFIWDCIYRPWSYGFYCFYLGLYLHSLELWFLLFLYRIVSTDPGVMISIVFIWDCIYTPWSYCFYCFYLGLYLQSLELWFLLFLPGIVST